ncbi:hypothetical protein LJC74_03240 [Eubacteriales bacterium OttesenSCG-928-A19]|nr:hypothetical protein [Eubacteriales bacterium OttesenSCG-928-A19]
MLKIEFEFPTAEAAAVAIQAVIAAQRGTVATETPAAPAPALVQAPVATAAPVAAPATPAAPVAPPAVPVTAAPAFTREQIMTAGAALIDAGKMNELMTLFNTFGVRAVTQLKQEQLGTFATELRKLGAQI